jgi:WD40 repeat protein
MSVRNSTLHKDPTMKMFKIFYGLFLSCFIFLETRTMDIEKPSTIIIEKIYRFSPSDNNTTAILQLTSEILISGSKQGNIFIWDTRNKDYNLIKKLHGHFESVTSLIKRNNNTFISSSEKENTSKLWDIEKEESLAVNLAHETKFFFPPNTSIGLSNNKICLWDIKKNKNNFFIDSKNNTFSLEKISNNLFLAGCSNGVVKLWNIITGKVIRIFQHPNSEHPVNLITKISDDYFASACSTSARYAGSSIYIWNINTGKFIKEIPYELTYKSAGTFCSSYNTLKKMSNKFIVSGSLALTDQSSGEMCCWFEYLIKIWDIESIKPKHIQTICVHKSIRCNLLQENPKISIEIEQTDENHWIFWMEENENIVKYIIERI